MAWKGFVENYYGETAQFYPAPKQGQSGSSIVQEIDGRLQVTGILTWRVGDERSTSEENLRGGAIPISKFYDAASGKQRTGNSITPSVPPNAVWSKLETEKTEETKETKGKAAPAVEPAKVCIPAKVSEKTKVNPLIKTLPVLHLSEDAPLVKTYKNLILYVYTSESCIPCQQSKPILAKLKKEGFSIVEISLENPEGKESWKEQGFEMVPAFLLHRVTKDSAEEKARWTGNENLEAKIRMRFSQYGEGEAVKKEENKEKGEKEGETGLRGRQKEKPPASPLPGKTSGSDSGTPGNVSPLLDLYGLSQPPAVSGEKEENKIFPFGKGNSDDSSVFGNDAKIQGIIDRIAGNLVSKLEETAKKKVQQYEPAAKEKIKEGADLFVDSAFKKSVTYFKNSYLLWLVGVMVIANLLSSALLKLLGYLYTRDWPIKITFQKTKEEKTE